MNISHFSTFSKQNYTKFYYYYQTFCRSRVYSGISYTSRKMQLKAATAQSQPKGDWIEAEDGYNYNFAFGSNMAIEGIKSKGLEIVETSRAVLKDYQLVFDIKTGMLSDPSYANIIEKKGCEVHGVLLKFSQANYNKLMSIEAVYYPKPVVVQQYSQDGGQKVYCTACVLDQDKYREYFKSEPSEVAPGWRYLGIITRGARDQGIDPAYIAQLEGVKAAPAPNIVDYMTPDIMQVLYSKEFKEADVVGQDEDGWYYTMIKDIVISVHPRLKFLAEMKDQTLFKAQSVSDCDDLNNLTESQKRFINEYACDCLTGMGGMVRVKGRCVDTRKYDF